MTAERVLDRLDGAKAIRDSAWIARCPAHPDRNPSLSIGLGDDNRMLLHCHAGCATADVLAALGLTEADLFAERNGDDPAPKTRKRKSSPEPLPTEEEVAEWQSALLDSPAALSKAQQLKGWSPAALKKLGVGAHAGRLRFPIRDADGQLVNVIAYKPVPKDRESKSIALRGRPRGLFPAPECVEGAEVWLVEGEPDSASGATLGIPAVAVPGVKGWKAEYAKRFAGRRIVVCMDCDKPGREVAGRIALDLAEAKVEHRVVDLDPSRTDGYDLSDHLCTAGTVGEAREALLGLADGAKAHVLEPVPTTGDLLDGLERLIRKYVVTSDEQRCVLALWVLHSHAIGAADTTPYVAITSAEKRSGKSRLLEVLAQLVPRPLEAANISDAALFRALGGEDELPATLLFDEVDAIFKVKEKEELRGLLNAGYRRGAKAYRCVGDGARQTVTPFPVFGPKALAGIGELPDTIADRSIPIRLRRRSRDEPVARGRYKLIAADCEPLLAAAAGWARASADVLRDANPDLPDALNDREQDGGEPLLAIADLAGGEWPRRARSALVELHADKSEESESWGVRLLADARTAFMDEDRITTAELIERLGADEEAPWAAWGKADAGLTPRGLAKLLKPYGIRSGDIRTASGTLKGYKREDFIDTWGRYLPPGTPPIRDMGDNGSAEPKTGGSLSATEGELSRIESGRKPHGNADVADVADGTYNGEPEAATPAEEAELDRIAAKLGGAA